MTNGSSEEDPHSPGRERDTGFYLLGEKAQAHIGHISPRATAHYCDAANIDLGLARQPDQRGFDIAIAQFQIDQFQDLPVIGQRGLAVPAHVNGQDGVAALE